MEKSPRGYARPDTAFLTAEAVRIDAEARQRKETPAALAVVAQLPADLAACFLDTALLSTFPRTADVWKAYFHVSDRGRVFAVQNGLQPLLDDPALPVEQRQLAQQVRSFHNWHQAGPP